MTQPGDQVRVEPGDLRGKAVDLSTVTTDVSATPTAPCAFTFVQSATAQIVAGANTLQSYVAAGNAEAERLAAVLREAAGTYEKVDERTRYALDHDPPLPVPTDPVPVNPLLPPIVPTITQPPLMAAMNGGDTGGYLDPKTAAQLIHSGDPGPMRTYADDARDFASRLRARSDAFSLAGVNWDGSAAESAGNALRAHQEWLNEIAEQYEYLADQAEDLAQDQEQWAREHPTVQQVVDAEDAVNRAAKNRDPVAFGAALGAYEALVAKSEEVLVGYSADVTGKGLLGVPKPPPGAAPFGPVSGNGVPRKANQPHQPVPQRDGGPQRPSTGRGGDPARGAPQQPVGATPPMAEPMTQPQSAPRGRTGGWRCAIRRWRTLRRGSTIGRWHAGRPARRIARRQTGWHAEAADRPWPQAGGSPRRRRGGWRCGSRRWRRRWRCAVVAVAAGGGRGNRRPGAVRCGAWRDGCRSRSRGGRWRCDGRRYGADGPRRWCRPG